MSGPGKNEGPTVGAVGPLAETRNESSYSQAAPLAGQALRIIERESKVSAYLSRLQAQHADPDEPTLKGYSLSRTHVGDGPVRFHVNRWGMVRELRDIAAVRAFAQQVGASDA